MSQSKVALVTGSAGKRVGWHIAEALAARGYAIVLHSRTPRPEANEAVETLRRRGVEALLLHAELTDERVARSMVDQALARFHRLDVLVNAAATWDKKRLEDVTAADIRRHFDANVLGSFLCAQQAGLAMVKQPDGGCIINVGDWATARPYVDYAAYFPSKGAIPALTRSLAVELGTRNPAVRVNCILPGPVMLPPNLPADEREKSIRGTLVRREGKPENVAQAVLALVENDFITGACLTVDGGRSIYAADSV
jgi:pteridine reductase